MPEQINIHENGRLTSTFEIEEVIETVSLRSEAVHEIISRRPQFAERWALLLFLLILLIVFSGTWFIRYPDIIQGNARLTATNAPKEIVPRVDGKLIKLFVHNDDKITHGNIIAWLESTGNHQEILALSNILDSSILLLGNNKTENVSAFFLRPFQNLGELQSSYQQFVTAWQQFNDYLINGYYYKRKQVLAKDLSFLKKMHSVLDEQNELSLQDLIITQEEFDANNSLFNEKVISKQDLRNQKSKLLGKKMNLPQMHSTLLTNENQQTAKQKDINELEHNIAQQKTIFLQALQTLKCTTDDWIKKYIIKAPVDGKVVFIMPLQENQFIQTGKILGFVNPANSRYYVEVNLPQNNFGKIDTGQKVQLRFDAYPYQEFGFVEGRLQYISKIPSDSGFLANINLPKGLTTNYKKEVQYKNGLKAQAMIVTKDYRLLQRFYYTIIKGMQL